MPSHAEPFILAIYKKLPADKIVRLHPRSHVQAKVTWSGSWKAVKVVDEIFNPARLTYPPLGKLLQSHERQAYEHFQREGPCESKGTRARCRSSPQYLPICQTSLPLGSLYTSVPEIDLNQRISSHIWGAGRTLSLLSI